LGAAYLGTKFVGLDSTISLFQRAGLLWTQLFPKSGKDQARIWREVEASYQCLPIAVRCLDQALVTWCLLNRHGYPARMKIGVNMTPVASHAWVECGNRTFLESIVIPDLHVVAEYGPWR
jgi:hypothetical protein